MALLVIGGLAFLVFRPAGSSSNHPARRGAHALGENNLGVVYGATAHQLLNRLASPDRKKAGCWIYNAPDGKVNGIETSEGVDGMKYCFRDGVVSDIQWHFKTFMFHKAPVLAHWGPPEDFGSRLTPPNVMAG